MNSSDKPKLVDYIDLPAKVDKAKKELPIKPKMQMSIDDHERIARITGEYLETLKSYRVAVDRLSKNEMRRVMIHVAEEPLDPTVELSSDREKEAARIGVIIKGMHTHLTLESLAQTPEVHKPEEELDVEKHED